MQDETADVQWSRVLRRSFGIPDIVSKENAIKSIQGWICSQLASSNLSDVEQIAVSRDLLTAVFAVAVRGDLDFFVLSSLAQQRVPTNETASEIIIQEMDSKAVVSTTDATQSVLAAAEAVVDRMIDYVGRHRFTSE